MTYCATPENYQMPVVLSKTQRTLFTKVERNASKGRHQHLDKLCCLFLQAKADRRSSGKVVSLDLMGIIGFWNSRSQLITQK